jgi:integrase
VRFFHFLVATLITLLHASAVAAYPGVRKLERLMMPQVALTDRFCSSAKADGLRTEYRDVLVPGLALRVTNTGHRSWSFVFTSPRDRNLARVTIGTYPATGLAAAREKANEARGLVEMGEDPRVTLAGQHSAGMTIADMVANYLKKPNRKTGKPRKSIGEIERRLNKNILPIIGQMKVAELHRRDVTRCLDPINNRGSSIEAARCFQDLRSMLRWGVGRGDLDHNPIEGMEVPIDSQPRERTLADDEIHTLWHALPEALEWSPHSQLIIKLCLATGQRVGEVSGIMKAELDLKAALWKLPGGRTKNGHAHTVPLSDLALSIIREASKAAGDAPVLFPCGKGSLAPAAVAGAILRGNRTTRGRALGRFGIASWAAHDLRRTAITRMAELGVVPVVLGHIANHLTTTQAGVTLRVYNQYDYAKEKREALDLWAERLTAIVDGSAARVIAIRRAQ